MSDMTVSPEPLAEGVLEVVALDLEAQGIARKPDGKVIFIEGALPFEQVTARTYRKKSNLEQATVTAILRESSQRVRPGCPHFGLHPGACGGCKMQHLHAGAQVAVKQRALEDNLWHLAKVRPATVMRPIEGPTWAYRFRARLSVRNVLKKGVVLVGFHERKSGYVADMVECHVLPRYVSDLLVPLRGLIGSMDARDTCPQIELACGDDVCAMVLRHLQPLSDGDRALLRAFTAQHPRVQWWLQSQGPDTVTLLDPPEPSRQLAYALPEFGVVMPFKPTDFTQVNPEINRVLVGKALRLLDVQRADRVIDWFCGLGNFTLPLATRAAQVLGVEGSEALVARSRENYELNRSVAGVEAGWAAIEFEASNLFEMTADRLRDYKTAQRWLIDPPREGAFALVKALVEANQQKQRLNDAADALSTGAARWEPPQRIVYVSCNPATLARDTGLLVHEAGYACMAAGTVNMFPHTAHVESIAVFDWLGMAAVRQPVAVDAASAAAEPPVAQASDLAI